MGIRNRERRQAKQKARAQRERSREERNRQSFDGQFPPPRPAAERIAVAVGELLVAAVHALHNRDERGAAQALDALVTRSPDAPHLVDAAVVAILHREVTGAWRRGWQPADLARRARREHGARHARLMTDLIAAAMRPYAAATIDVRWVAQLAELDATVWWERDDAHLADFGHRERLDRPELMRCAAEVLTALTTCPQIQMLCPLPGEARPGSRAEPPRPRRTAQPGAAQPGAGQPRHLDRVRALLAKAESTTFPEEAEAYTAKAQELMARYSIDEALLAANLGAREEPIGRRIGVDNPYEGPKALLLDQVARANRCRAVWSSEFGFVTVLGFAPDVDSVELLFTSLLVQATAAMVQAGSRRDAYGRSSTRSFRQSFLTAYAHRIGERLTESTRHATAEAVREAGAGAAPGRSGADLLPVLASREEKVDEFTEELFSGLVGKHVTVSNREGWASGRAAADRAHLHPRTPVAAS